VKQGCLLSPLLFGLYLDALEGHLDSRECNALALANLHVWLLLFANDLTMTSKSVWMLLFANDFALTSESEVGLHQ
jgi:hypothetical protein